MKNLTLILFTFVYSTSQAKNYYFSTSQGDDSRIVLQAQNPATPWKSIGKLNSFNNLQPGDSVLFQKGDTFYGTISIAHSGSSGNPIIYDAYGTGANPTISGFTTISSWVHLGNNIWESKNPVSTLSSLNLVEINGVATAMGRFPNTGYLNYQSHTFNTSITSRSITGNVDWTGGEVVIRKYRWILDRHPITSQSGGKLTYNALATYGNNNAYSPLDGNGFFIQNDSLTLDLQNEWFYSTSKKLKIYSIIVPNNVKTSSLDNDLIVNSQNYITFNNLNFEGSNTNGAYLVAANNITFNNCNFYQHGGNAIYGISVSYITVNGSNISNALNNGIWIEYQGSNITIDNVTTHNIGTIAGAGRSGDGAQEGIAISGNATIIRNCSIKNTGYNGIRFNGNNAMVENNIVDSFCIIKDDGGGIYTYEDDGITTANRIVRNNIILHAVGSYAGAGWHYWEPFGKAAGIYIDGYSNHTKIYNNTVAHGNWAGIFENNNFDNQILDNTVYNTSMGLYVVAYNSQINNIIWRNNKFVSKRVNQSPLFIETYVNDNTLSFATSDSNYYVRPLDDSATITVYHKYQGGNGIVNSTLTQWQNDYTKDKNSIKSNVSFVTPIDSNILFIYNPTLLNKNVFVSDIYVDVTNKTYSGDISLSAYSSLILFKTAATISVLPLKFLNFTAKQIEKNVALLWTISDYINVNQFEIERSSDGNKFEFIDTIPFKSDVHSYEFTDYKPFNGKTYYRIKEKDLDGKFIYSKIISVSTNQMSELNVFPNPAINFLNVKFKVSGNNLPLNLSIKNLQGLEIKKYPVVSSAGNMIFDTSSFAPGLYFLTISGDDININKRFIKL